MNHIEHVGHQRVNPRCSIGLTGLRGTRAVADQAGLRKSLRDISLKGQTKERSESHVGQSKCSGAVVTGLEGLQ